MKRTIFQIASRYVSNEDEASVLALADDGTLWEGNKVRVALEKELRCPDTQRLLKAAVYKYEFQWERLIDLPERYSDNFTKVR